MTDNLSKVLERLRNSKNNPSEPEKEVEEVKKNVKKDEDLEDLDDDENLEEELDEDDEDDDEKEELEKEEVEKEENKPKEEQKKVGDLESLEEDKPKVNNEVVLAEQIALLQNSGIFRAGLLERMDDIIKNLNNLPKIEQNLHILNTLISKLIGDQDEE